LRIFQKKVMIKRKRIKRKGTRGKVRRLIEMGKRTGRKRTRGKVRRLIKGEREPGEREPGERSGD